MNIKSTFRIICISLLITLIMLSNIGFVLGATSQELKDQQSEIDKKIAEKTSELAGKKSEMTTALNQINKLNSDINTYEHEISNLQTQISNLDAQIAEKQANIEEEQKKFDTQKELLEDRLVAMYEAGQMSYLDMLLSSDGLTEFISNYYLISEIAEYDEDLLNKIETTRKKIEDEKAYIESSREEIKTSKTAVESKKNSLSLSVNQKKDLVSTLTAEEAAIQDELEEFEKDKKEIQRQLSALAAKNGTVKPVAPSAAGYGTPIPGKTKANITTGYYGYAGHTGVDFACSAGTTIQAVKSGTVVISTALRRANGTYKSYGEYVVIDHHDGTMTLYAHMLSGSRAVSAGQTVSQGQAIGQVGSTGNSTGNHLHFEVRVGGYTVNPTQYLP